VTTAAVDSGLFGEAFAARAATRAAEPGWLERRRADAFARFERHGLPTPRLEEWKYTNVAPIARGRFAHPEAAPSRLDRSALGSLTLGGALPREIVFVNGRLSRELSRGLGDGALEVESLPEALARGSAWVEHHLGRVADDERNAFLALNTALHADGVVVRVGRSHTIDEPLHVVYFSTGLGAEPPASHPRLLVLVERGAQATLVESFGGPAGESYLTNAVTEIVLADGAGLDHYRLQEEGAAAFHVASQAVRLGRDSRYASHSIQLGAALARTDIRAVFSDPGAECVLNGLFVTGAAQHSDTHTLIDHAVPHCTSRQLYKGVLDDRSRGVFFGRILVRADAQKTDAEQTNKNLLLSREALVDSTPQLEILADDVRCKHGSTTGQLDPQALFYLRSRGIGAEAARALLTYAFASDVVQRIRVRCLREELESFLQDRLPGTALLKEAAL
jgi:Fe-S cluster assembly protein SufD